MNPLLSPMKIDLIEHCLPVESVVDFGGSWRVQGGYSVLCATDYKAKQVCMIDDLIPKVNLPSNMKFIRGDFTDGDILKQVPQAELVLMFDIILHQYGPVKALFDMMEKSTKYIAFVQPIVRQEVFPFESEMVFLQGLTDEKQQKLFDPEINPVLYPEGFYCPKKYLRNRWLWAISKKLLINCVERQGFKIFYENNKHINTNWHYWGFVAKKEG